MKATELMIGDWVCYNKPNGYLTRVDDIRRTGDARLGYVYSITCKRDKRDPLHENIPVDAFNVEILHPIPLTPEILISNGFVLIDEKDKMYRWDYGEGVYVNADFKSEEPWVSVVNTCYHSVPYCPYLHQLQHALLSCGIVKELKPDMPGDCPLAGVEKKNIYIVTGGCYSDYHIERVFSTKEKAEEFLDMKDDDYDLAVFPLDEDLPQRDTKIWRVVLELNTKKVLKCYICFDKTMKDLVQFNKYSYDEKNGIEFYIETCSRRRAKKIASERYGAVIANEQTMYPYLRQRVLEGDGYPYYDFNTGEIVLMDGDEFDDSILTYDAETYDESKLAEYLPQGMRFRRAKKEEGKL